LWYLLQNYRYCSKVPKPHNLVLYIPGHQDTKSTKPLTVQEIHNVECDPLAKQFVKAHPTQSTTFNNPKMVAAWVQLLINGKVICQWFLPASRQAAATADYMEYLQIRFTWTHADTQTVSWPMLHLALQTLPHHNQQCIVLFIHDKLPLHASKFHPHLGSTLCPSCKWDTEDYWHFLECDHIDWQKLFKQLKKQLTALSVKHQLHPSILTTFWLGLLAICNDTQYPQIEVELPLHLQPVFRVQTHLGWDQLYHRCISSNWEKAIDGFHPHLMLPVCQIMVQLIHVIWNYILSMWQLCNTHPLPGQQCHELSRLPTSSCPKYVQNGNPAPHCHKRGSVPVPTPRNARPATSSSLQMAWMKHSLH